MGHGNGAGLEVIAATGGARDAAIQPGQGHTIEAPLGPNRQSALRSFASPALTMYVVELSLKLSSMPISVQRKELGDAQALYREIRAAMENGHPRVLEISCEKAEEKHVSLLSTELVAVQIYEKSAVGGGSKRPGFSFET
jgi:hypothetical protein